MLLELWAFHFLLGLGIYIRKKLAGQIDLLI
jgi:hypothetical protein